MLKPRQRPALLSEMESDLRRFLRGADSLLERGDAKELMILDLELRHFAFLLLRDLLQLLHLLACFHTFQFAPGVCVAQGVAGIEDLALQHALPMLALEGLLGQLSILLGQLTSFALLLGREAFKLLAQAQLACQRAAGTEPWVYVHEDVHMYVRMCWYANAWPTWECSESISACISPSLSMCSRSSASSLLFSAASVAVSSWLSRAQRSSPRRRSRPRRSLSCSTSCSRRITITCDQQARTHMHAQVRVDTQMASMHRRATSSCILCIAITMTFCACSSSIAFLASVAAFAADSAWLCPPTRICHEAHERLHSHFISFHLMHMLREREQTERDRNSDQYTYGKICIIVYVTKHMRQWVRCLPSHKQ